MFGYETLRTPVRRLYDGKNHGISRMNTTRSVIVTLLSIMALSETAMGCDHASPSAIAPIDTLIDRSDRIVLARVEAANQLPPGRDAIDGVALNEDVERQRVTEQATGAKDRSFASLAMATMTVIENVKGSGSDRISRPKTGSGEISHDFDAHQATSFWQDATVGRIQFDGKCNPLVDYEPGKTYLIFIGPLHVKGAELIESEDDAWLAYVRARLDE